MHNDLNISCTIVIPCFNEAARLPRPELWQALAANPHLKLVLVDDGSQDNTRSQLESVRERYPERVRVIGLVHNQGKAEAVRRGMQCALEENATLCGYFDADLATPLSELAPMARYFDDEQVHLVIGSRVQLLGREVRRSAWRHYLGRVYASSASLVLGLGVYDTQCGAKLFRNSGVIQSLFAEPFTANWSFDVEILMRMLAQSAENTLPEIERAVVEHPLQVWRDVSGSKLGPRAALQAAAELLVLLRKYRL